MHQRRRGLRAPSLAAAALLAALPKAAAADAPAFPSQAVGQANAKLEVGGGVADSDELGGAALSLTVPLAQRYGLQADTAYYRAGQDDAYGAALHAFFRDPNTRLLGLTAMTASIDDLSLLRLGAESEFYLGRVTLAPSGGYQRFNDKDSAYGSFRFTYYPVDSLALSASAAGYSGAYGFGASTEYQLGSRNASLFVDAGGSDPGGGYVLAGFRLWLGGEGGGLIARDRNNDPPNLAAFWNTPAGNAMLAAEKIVQEPPCCVGCFVAGAEVLMADGSVRRIEQIGIGDEVMGADGMPNAVAGLQRPQGGQHLLMSVNRGPFFVNTRHAIATRQGWKAGRALGATEEYGSGDVRISQLTLGDDIRTRDGWETVESIDVRSSGGPVDLYNLIASGDNTFHVRGGSAFMLVHG